MKNYKVVNRKRFYFSVSLILIFVLMISFTLIVNAKDSGNISLVPIYVQSGDTLWGLSSSFVADHQDIRDYINTVMEVNKITEASLKPGQLLYFPQYN